MTMIVKVQAVRIYQVGVRSLIENVIIFCSIFQQDRSCPTVFLGSNGNAITLVEQSGADHEDLAVVVALVVLADLTPLGSLRAVSHCSFPTSAS